MPVEIVLEEGASAPEYATAGSAGADVRAFLKEPVVIEPGQRALISTGIKMAIPEGYEVQIRPRSGLALKHGISLPNTPATIDADYRGEVKVILINHGQEPFTVEPGMRIAQFVFAKALQTEWVEAKELATSSRGAGGFGHTGVQ